MKAYKLCDAACGACPTCRTTLRIRLWIEKDAAAAKAACAALVARFGSLEGACAEDAKYKPRARAGPSRRKDGPGGYVWVELLKRLEKRLGAAPAAPAAALAAAPAAAPAKAAKPARARAKVVATSVKAAKMTKRAGGGR